MVKIFFCLIILILVIPERTGLQPSLNVYGSHSGWNYLAIRNRREVAEPDQDTTVGVNPLEEPVVDQGHMKDMTEPDQDTAVAVHPFEEPVADQGYRREVAEPDQDITGAVNPLEDPVPEQEHVKDITEQDQDTAVGVHPLEESVADQGYRREVPEPDQDTAVAVHPLEEIVADQSYRREVPDPDQDAAVALYPFVEPVAEVDITDEEGEEVIHSIGQENTNLTYGNNHSEPSMNINETSPNSIFHPYFSNNSENLIGRPYPHLYEIPAIILIRLQEFKKRINEYLEMREKLGNTSDIEQLLMEDERLFADLNKTSVYQTPPELVLPDINPLPKYSSESDFSLQNFHRNVDKLDKSTGGTEMVTEGQWYISNNDTVLSKNFTQDEIAPKQLTLSPAVSQMVDPSTTEDAGEPVEIPSKGILLSSAELPMDNHPVINSMVPEDVERDISAIKPYKLEDSTFRDLVPTDDQVQPSQFISSDNYSKFDDSIVALYEGLQSAQNGMNSSEETSNGEPSLNVESLPDTYAFEPLKDKSDFISEDL